MPISKVPVKDLLEKDAEMYLHEHVRAMGGQCFKTILQAGRGYPDRTIFYEGKAYVVELKRSNRGELSEHRKRGELSEHQKRVHRKINSSGVDVYVLWGMPGTSGFLRGLAEGTLPVCIGVTRHYA